MVSFFSVTLLALAYISCLVNASPLAVRDPLDVAAPPVTYPTQGVVWTPGQTQTVTWDTSKLPAQITNPNAMVVLGWIDNTGSYNLQLKNPLASGIPITAGKVDIVVPSGYPDGNAYVVALIGSSDNISPTFTITNGGNGGGGSPSSAIPNTPTTTPTTPSQSTPVPDSQPTPTTTPAAGSPNQNNAGSPNPNPTTSPTSVSPSSSTPKSSPSSSPSGTSDSSNNSTNGNSSNSAWVNKPVSAMVVSLLAGSLVTFLL